MIDIKRIVEHTDEVKKALAKRMPESELDFSSIISGYEKKKELQAEFEKLRAEQKSHNDTMAKLDKKSDEFKKEVVSLKDLSAKIKKIEGEIREIDDDLQQKVSVLPNIPDEDIVAGGKEKNEVIKECGKKKDFDFKIKDHIELGKSLGILDFERASKMSGPQMAMYVGDGALLEWALIEYFKKFHVKNGYTAVIPPHLLNEESAYVAGQLPKFKEDLYWTQDSQCLLPTAETALINIYRGETLDEKDLPKKFFSYTPCYRREAGTYGAADKGLKRMHQFDKVEMFQYTTPDQSADAFEELVANAVKLVEGLGLACRVSKLAAEDMSFGMARTYDIEVWLPFANDWSEVSSVSNAKDFQARRGNIKYKSGKDGKTYFVHTLNGSGLATSRLMIALIEAYQQKDGSIKVPEVLRDYVGKDVISA